LRLLSGLSAGGGRLLLKRTTLFDGRGIHRGRSQCCSLGCPGLGGTHLGGIGFFLARTIQIGLSRIVRIGPFAFGRTLILARVRILSCGMAESCQPMVLHLRGHLLLVWILEADILVVVWHNAQR
jgi:hypothetical protein